MAQQQLSHDSIAHTQSPPPAAGFPVYGVEVALPIWKIDMVAIDARRRRHVAIRREDPLHGQARNVIDADRLFGALKSSVIQVLSGGGPHCIAAVSGLHYCGHHQRSGTRRAR